MRGNLGVPDWLLQRVKRLRAGASRWGLGAMVLLGLTPEAIAAERIEFFIGPFEPVIWIDDLATFAAEGTVTDRFAPVADRLNASQKEQLRTFLNEELDVDLVTLSQFSYWQVGERFLDRAGQVVKTDNLLNGSRALRAALLFAAEDGDGITPLEVMQEFPLEVIQLDYELFQQVLQENQQFFASREALIAELRAIAEQEAIAFPVPTDLPDPAQAGPYDWQQETLTFTNPLRGEGIPFDVYLPQMAAGEQSPAIVVSHGVASGRSAFRYLAQHLASHGYTVVVPQHDDDSQKYVEFLAGVDRPPNPITLVSRPRDISLVLDELEQRSQTDAQYRQIDFENVGVFGHSLGGFTVLAAAGATFNFATLQQNCSLADRDRPSLNPSLLVQCDLLDLAADAPFALKDDRIQAVFALSPPTSLFFGEAGLAQIDSPTLIAAVSADIVVPAVPEQILPYDWLQTEDRYLAIIENATHFSFLEGNLNEGALPLPERLLGPNPQLARPYLKTLSLAFFNRHLREQTEADGFLTQPYLDSLGDAPFRATLVRSQEQLIRQTLDPGMFDLFTSTQQP